MAAPSDCILVAFKVRKITPFLRYLMFLLNDIDVIYPVRRLPSALPHLCDSVYTLKKHLYPGVFNRSFSLSLSFVSVNIC